MNTRLRIGVREGIRYGLWFAGLYKQTGSQGALGLLPCPSQPQLPPPPPPPPHLPCSPELGLGKRRASEREAMTLTMVEVEGSMVKQEGGSPESTQPEDWMMEDRSSTKRAEKEALASGVAKRPKVGLAESGAVDKAAEQEDGSSEPRPAAAKKTMLVRVKQEYIDWLQRTPYRPFRGVPQELLDEDKDDPESLRDLLARVAARHQEQRDRDLAILAQYEKNGFAHVEVEVEVDVSGDEAGGPCGGRGCESGIASVSC